MTKAEIVTELIETKCDVRTHRDRLYRLIGESENNVPDLLDLTFGGDDYLSFRASRILEFVCKNNLNHLVPHLAFFTKNISQVSHHSTKRVVGKICELIAYAYTHKQSNLTQETLTEKQKERIITACLDWMIQPEKMAVHAYAMQTLFLLGEKWVHEELKQILEDKMAFASTGYVARARKILKAMD
jgi:hypothetical protein